MPVFSFAGPAVVSSPIIAPHSTLYKTPEWSFAFWVKIDTSIFTDGVLSTEVGGGLVTAGYCCKLYDLGMYLGLNGTAENAIASLSVSGPWRHHAVVFDSTEMKRYVDGAEYGGPITTLGAMVWGTNPLTIAAFAAQPARMTMIGLWDRKLTDAEVAILASGVDVPAGLVARWAGTEGSGSTIADDIGTLDAVTPGAITWSSDIPTQLASWTPGGGGTEMGAVGFFSPLIQGA